MKLKKLIFPLFSLILTYLSFEIVNQLLQSNAGEISNKEQIIVSVLLCLYVTGVFAFPGFVYTSNRMLPKTYYTIKNPQILKKVYKIFGVKNFKYLLMLVFWGIKKNRRKYFNGRKDGIDNLIYQSKQSEFGHLGAFVSIFIIGFVILIKGFYLIFIVSGLINIIGNLYPIILQRYHRMRVQKLKQMKEKV